MAEQLSEMNQAAGDSTVSAENSEDSNAGWDLRSIFSGAISSRSLQSGVEAGYAAGSSREGQEFWKNLNVCNPQKWSDYVVAGMVAGGTFAYCSGKYSKQLQESSAKQGDSK